jgi:hypothetical protein
VAPGGPGLGNFQIDEDVNRPPKQTASPRDAQSTKGPTVGLPLGSTEARLGALVAVALVVGLVVWLLASGGDDSTPTSVDAATEASAEDLAALPATVGHPVYWAGPKGGFTYELTRTSDDRIYIRYLPEGVPIGSDQPDYLAVGTYRSQNALAVVRGIAKDLHVKAVRLRGGGAAVQDTKHPTSVYLAYPGTDYQIEVYDPSPARALQLAVSGKIVPLGPNNGPGQATAARPRAATVQQLQAVDASRGRAVYWVGPQSGATYELTETSDNKVYVRYLPSGTKVGDQQPHTTVGTYPFKNPLAAVRGIANDTGGRTFSIPGGGLAAVNARHPTSVYVAFPGVDYQIEVFDPSASRARELVSSGRVAPVR